MTRRGQTRAFRAIGLALAALAVAGCGRKLTDVYPVRGQVFYNGKPTPGARVVFHPVRAGEAKSAVQTHLPTGEVQADGSFTLRTHPLGDGAPAGEYLVAIVWLDDNRRGEDGSVPNR